MHFQNWLHRILWNIAKYLVALHMCFTEMRRAYHYTYQTQKPVWRRLEVQMKLFSVELIILV